MKKPLNFVPGKAFGKLHRNNWFQVLLQCLLFILITSPGLYAQQDEIQPYQEPNIRRAGEIRLLQQQPEYHLQPINREAALHVIGNNNDTAVVMADPGKFRLRDDQKIAAMQTAQFISPVMNEAVINRLDLKKGQGFVLPEVYYAKAEGDNEVLIFQIIFVNTSPMRLDMDKSVFRGTMQFLPVEVSNNAVAGTTPKVLLEPLDIYVITPESKDKITLTQINWPLVDYTVMATRPMDTVEIRVSTIINPLGYKQVLKVEPAIKIEPGSFDIQGYGIQTTPVYISLTGTSSSARVPVALKISEGFLAKDTFNLQSTGIAKTELRSAGLGKATVSVFNTTYISNSFEINYLFPWMFLLFSLGGGIIGSLVQVLKVGKPVKARPLIIGALSGFIVALCYWALGLKLLDISVNITYFNEFAVLALSILGGYIKLPDFRQNKKLP